MSSSLPWFAFVKLFSSSGSSRLRVFVSLRLCVKAACPGVMEFNAKTLRRRAAKEELFYSRQRSKTGEHREENFTEGNEGRKEDLFERLSSLSSFASVKLFSSSGSLRLCVFALKLLTRGDGI